MLRVLRTWNWRFRIGLIKSYSCEELRTTIRRKSIDPREYTTKTRYGPYQRVYLVPRGGYIYHLEWLTGELMAGGGRIWNRMSGRYQCVSVPVGQVLYILAWEFCIRDVLNFLSSMNRCTVGYSFVVTYGREIRQFMMKKRRKVGTHLCLLPKTRDHER